MANRVGVRVTRATAGPLSVGPDPGDSVLLAVVAARGPENVPQLITSMARYEAVFGGPTPFADGARFSTGYEVAKVLFQKGVRRIWVVRIVGASATTSQVDLQDRAGTPLDTLRVKAKGAGAWADGYKIVIADGTRTNTFRLTCTDASDNVLESWDNLTMAATELARVRGDYIEVENVGSSTVAPENRPAVGTITIDVATDGGVDDNAPAASVIVGSETLGVKTGLKSFRSRAYGRGFLLAPDLDTDTTVATEMKAQGEAFFRLPLSSSQPGAAVADAVTQRGSDWQEFHTGFYFPRARVEDTTSGEIKTIPITGHVVGDWLQAIEREGPGKAPAGAEFRVDGVLGLEVQANGQPLVDEGVAEYLLSEGINPAWDRNRQGVRIWGARTGQNSGAWVYLHGSYLWMLIADTFFRALDAYVYANLDDGQTFTAIEAGLFSFLADLHVEGAFRGELPTPGQAVDPEVHAFDVRCDEELLSASDEASGILRVAAWFREARTGETIEVELAKRTG
ncbi:MAG: hypothetical protein AAGI01_05475 [Myxococcota bacterium]